MNAKQDIQTCSEITFLVQTPEYCALGDGQVHTVNAWIGPAGTETPLHTDPHHNLFVQVVGYKYIQLFSPSETDKMYPHESGMTTNSSRVDAMAPDEGSFPLFKAATGLQLFVQPGQALYIPPGECLYYLLSTVLHLHALCENLSTLGFKSPIRTASTLCRLVALRSSRDSQHLSLLLVVVTSFW